ncbi:MAG: hypothetical protein JJU05_05330 [Verrucomicrobia bacterium]|nr:hypothetical protein [Verrucomicrobiota bacterium]MCH8525833.1 hypothetical protein [Kiritimatiellia bacterium]
MNRVLNLLRFGLFAGLCLSGGCRILFRRADRPLPPPPERALRLPPRGAPLTGFEQIAGWSVNSPTGRVRLDKDRAKAIWGEYAGWVRFTPRQSGPHRVEIRPGEPWRVNSPFNIITIWVWHDRGGTSPSGGYELVLHGTGTRGRAYSWHFPYRPRDGWQMLHLRVEGEESWPLDLTHLTWHLPAGVEGQQDLYLENLRVYQESVARIPRDIQFIRPHDYAPAFAPRRQGSVLLDFPPRPAAFRPNPPTERYLVSLEQKENNTYHFRSQSGNTTVEYRVALRENFPEISVRVNEVDLGRIWRGVAVHTQGEAPVFRLSRMEEDKLILQYTEGLRFSVSLQGRTLELEAHSLNETFTGVDLGRFSGSESVSVERLDVPFMRLADDFRWPTALVRKESNLFFASVIPDWWFSMAGEAAPPETEEGMGLGRLLYPARWKGSRNVFRERIYFTVSTGFDDVMPGAAAPPAHLREEAGQFFLPSDEGLTLRLIHMRPTDPDWREDDLARDPEGNWRGYAPQRYFMKSARFFDLALSRLDTGTHQGVYTHAHAPWLSRFPPWRFTDFDARVLGAGTFAQTWAELGVLLQQSTAETGLPLLGDGGSEWLYSGLLSGLVPEFAEGFQSLHPFLPQLAHQNISPYSALMGMGGTRSFQRPDETDVPESELFWRQIATQIAYTAAGRIPEVADPDLRDLARNILAPIHERFTRSRVVRLLYWNGTRLQSVTEAFSDQTLCLSQIYFRLESGEEIWVNGSFEKDWPLEIQGGIFQLPPFGFFFRGPDFTLKRVRSGEGPSYSLFQGSGASWRVDETP